MSTKVLSDAQEKYESEILRCTDTLICPNNSWWIVDQWYRMRYYLIRCSSQPSLPPSFPLIGGRNIIEVTAMSAILAVGIYITIVLGDDAFGEIASWAAGMGVLLGLRNNPLTLVLGVSFERALFWHKLVCLSAVIFSIAHGYLVIKKHVEHDTLTGIVLFGLMILTSVVYLAKRCSFEVFYFLHLMFLLVITAFCFIHRAWAFAACTIVWALDIAIRYILLGKRIEATAMVLPAGVIRVRFPRPFQFSAGQFVFVMIPLLSPFQYHPFTISSAPHEDNVTLHIRSLGNWTNELHEFVLKEAGGKLHTGIPLTICLEGPFGLCSVDLADPMYRVILLISGGIGVTPGQSIFNDFIHRHQHNGVPALRKCIFVWSVKDRAMEDAMKVVISGSCGNSTKDLESNSNNNNDLPLSFQPDLVQISSVNPDIATAAAATALTETENCTTDADDIMLEPPTETFEPLDAFFPSPGTPFSWGSRSRSNTLAPTPKGLSLRATTPSGKYLRLANPSRKETVSSVCNEENLGEELKDASQQEQQQQQDHYSGHDVSTFSPPSASQQSPSAEAYQPEMVPMTPISSHTPHSCRTIRSNGSYDIQSPSKVRFAQDSPGTGNVVDGEKQTGKTRPVSNRMVRIAEAAVEIEEQPLEQEVLQEGVISASATFTATATAVDVDDEKKEEEVDEEEKPTKHGFDGADTTAMKTFTPRSSRVITTKSNRVVLAPGITGSGKVVPSTIADKSVFHCEFYLTSVKPDPTSGMLPEHQPYLKFGRPDLANIFAQVADLCLAEAIDRVAVVTCGPLPMTREVHKLCQQRYPNVQFDLHVEEFDF